MASEMKYIAYNNSSILLAVRDGVVSELAQSFILSGRYEKREARTIIRLLENNERLLELGAGVGLISTIAWATGKVREVHCFEADPRLVPLIEQTHRINGVKGIIYNEVLTSSLNLLNAGSVDFYVRPNFYGSSIHTSASQNAIEKIAVRVRSFDEVLSAIRPTIIACDIEGGELGLFKNVDLSGVKHIMLETHQRILRGRGMRDVFSDLHNADFHFDQTFSKGSVSVFTRIDGT